MAAEEIQEIEETEAKLIRPSDLADELGVDAKSIRNFLRREFTRKAEQKNTSWYLTDEIADAVRAHFLGEEDDDAEEVEEVDDLDELEED